MTTGIDPSVAPSGPGCVECLADGGFWVHLRRCAQCGHIGCCDTSPSQHATKHFHQTQHPISQSYEPGEDWMWSFVEEQFLPEDEWVELAPPTSRPDDQPVPGPEGAVPDNWRDVIHR